MHAQLIGVLKVTVMIRYRKQKTSVSVMHEKEFSTGDWELMVSLEDLKKKL